jgi:2-amino-4-hydroxy-6-hydroxymethyldihydropteridine diphosphokinase
VTPTRQATPSVRVAVAIGSNLGDRAAHLAWAREGLARILTDLRCSPVENTAPLDVPDTQPDYLNAVVIGRTTLGPRALLDALLRLEVERGRTRPGVRSARTLDLDLVLYGDRVIEEPGLQVPHPRFRERDFVLGPLARLAPRWHDPVSGETLAALWRARRLPGRG